MAYAKWRTNELVSFHLTEVALRKLLNLTDEFVFESFNRGEGAGVILEINFKRTVDTTTVGGKETSRLVYDRKAPTTEKH